MRRLDVEQCEIASPEGCYHLTRAVHAPSIENIGLGADIGVRSRDGAGNERTSKVFFAKSLEGALIFLNRNFNVFYSAAKRNDFNFLRGPLRDDSPELYEQIFNAKVHDNMTQEELTDVALLLGTLYLQRGVYYKLNLKQCSKIDFEKMSDQEKAQIDYFPDDINEERPDEKPGINNMHTRSGRGIRSDQMILMTNNGKTSAWGVAMKMVEKYKELHPGKPLPVLVQRSGDKDRPLLEILYERYERTHGEIESKKKTDIDEFDY